MDQPDDAQQVAEAVEPIVPIAAAEHRAAGLAEERPFGRRGPAIDSRSPFYVGLFGAAGVAVAYTAFEVITQTRSVLVLILLALVLAIGLSPAVDRPIRRRFPRWAAVTTILPGAFVVLAGFLAAAVPPLIDQATRLVTRLVRTAPELWRSLPDRGSPLGHLNQRFHLRQRLTSLLSQHTDSLLSGVFGVGQIVFGVVASTLTVVVLTSYFLADLPRLRRMVHRLAPATRRPRAILPGDSISTSIGGFVLGNLFTSLVAGVLSFIWMVIFHVPYPLVLALFVAIMDLIPVVGSTAAGVVMVLAAWPVALPVAIATIGYVRAYRAYRAAEDDWLVPRIIGRTVRLPAVATFVAFLVGGVLLGVVGALIAIPVAAIRLFLIEVVFPRQDHA